MAAAAGPPPPIAELELPQAPRIVSEAFLTRHISRFGGEFRRLRLVGIDRGRQYRRHFEVVFALDTGGFPSPNAANQDDLKDDDAPGSGRTRLEVIVRAAGKQLLEKLNAARKNFPMKIFLLLLGFYTANALATILGQTGDWDVLVAGVVVAAIEGIGMLMYRKPMAAPSGRMQSLMVMLNYWKAGVCLGLFVDAFKLGS